MFQNEFFSQLQHGISRDRLEPYLSNRSPPQEGLALYAWNVTLCESLYPSLNSIEITLRNAIHQAASEYFADEYWLIAHATGREKSIVRKVNRDLQKFKSAPSAGDIVSNLLFGFWVKLLSNEYEGILWPHLLRLVLPHVPRRRRTIKYLHARLDSVRILRNRVFHHEPIWYLTDLEEQHRLILETIGWISPAMLAMTRMLDRFNSVYTMGPQHYTEELDSVAQSWSSK